MNEATELLTELNKIHKPNGEWCQTCLEPFPCQTIYLYRKYYRSLGTPLWEESDVS